MKVAYQEKILSNFDAIEKRTNLLREVAGGKRPDISADQAIKILGEIDHLLEQSRNMVELVQTR